ncbi:MAG TPA: hypothetical protein VFA90_13155 [Terriglobales bacterium]|nr:hypothetical protein [Terriglobales bacterium]
MHKLTTFLLFIFLAVEALPSQQAPLPPEIGNPHTEEPNNLPPDVRSDMEKKRNEERQADLKRDTDKLLKLSTELKQYVDKSNENILSMDVIKKADEIEKLAHSVKTKMRGDNYGAPAPTQ